MVHTPVAGGRVGSVVPVVVGRGPSLNPGSELRKVESLLRGERRHVQLMVQLVLVGRSRVEAAWAYVDGVRGGRRGGGNQDCGQAGDMAIR